ncbi:dimethyladenosine transferase, partial [Perkinsus olseni]
PTVVAERLSYDKGGLLYAAWPLGAALERLDFVVAFRFLAMIRRPAASRGVHRSSPIGVIKAPGSNKNTLPRGAGGQKAAGGGGGLALPLQKKFGQHLLKNPGILDKIIEASDIKSTDTVLEIGPGTGNLTMRLLELAKKVVALEIDPRMAAEVKKRAQTSGRMNLKVIEGDALKTAFPVFDVCVANLPYQISSPFTFKLLAHRPVFRCGVIMFQKEFGERLVARVGEENYGRLAINCQLFSKVTRVCNVSKGSFNPPPEVDSMIVKFVLHKDPINVDFPEFDGLLRIAFTRKNKTLHSSFMNKAVIKVLEENYKTYCSLHSQPVQYQGPAFKAHVENTLRGSGLAESRAMKIDIDQYLALLLEFHRNGIHFVNVSDPSTTTNKAATDAFSMEVDSA